MAAIFLGSAANAGSAASETQRQDWEVHRAGPVESRSVYWIGHSLMEAKVETAAGRIDLLTLVGEFAKSRGLGYRLGDHTLWGASLSAMWRGRPHSYERDAAQMLEKRQAFEANPQLWDAVVATEGLPLRSSLRNEFSSYYLRRFYCTAKRANPQARVYVYESYIHFNGSDPGGNYGPQEQFDWRTQMMAQSSVWDELADTAASGKARSPGPLSKIGLSLQSNAGCDSTDPIFTVPVGRTMLRLAERLAAPKPGDSFVLATGDPLRMSDLFANPYVDWPEGWPLKARASDSDVKKALGRLRLKHSDRPLDDIHPSAVGIYLTALVHFATLYRQSPVGLPAPEFIGTDLARSLQCIAWETVLSTPRAGVRGELACQ